MTNPRKGPYRPLYKGETWIEPEELCYPNGAMDRRCYCNYENRKVIAYCGLPETPTSSIIPACIRIKDIRVRGFVTSNENDFTFHKNGEKSYNIDHAIDTALTKLKRITKT
jgi:hypothetical protein